MKKLLIANWKQNKNIAETTSFLSGVNFVAKEYDVVIAPSFPYLSLVKELLPKQAFLGAQDVSSFPHGTYTGAVGAFQLADFGVNYVIVGHSERRKYFNETAQEINNKVRELESQSLIPIVCFSQIDELRKLEINTNNYYLAFEPVDAIGTGTSYENNEIEDTFKKAKELFPESNLIYGGSVNNENIDRLKEIDNIMGFLVGTASLNIDKFNKLIEVL